MPAEDARVCAVEGCEAAVTARTRYGWAKFRECGELLYGRRFPLKRKWAVNKSYLKSAILYGSEAWSQKEMRWEFYKGQKDPWLEQCVECNSETEGDLRIFCSYWV